jgi:hypothetical protein
MEKYKNFKLNPNFVTGLTEAEWCFLVNVYKNKKAKFKRSVKLWHYPKDNTVRYRVQDIFSIKKKKKFFFFLPHFF